MSETLIAVLVLVAVTVAPLVPAFILYRFIDAKSTAAAEGPLHGLTVKLGGPIAGYMVIFLSLLYVRPRESQHFHTWTVEGSVAFETAEGEPEPNVNDVVVRFVPPRLAVLNQGLFVWEIPVIESDDGRRQFPDLQLDLRGHRGLTVPLGPNRTYGSVAVAPEYDEKHRRITLKQPIVMRSVSADRAYLGSKAQSPAPVPTPIPALAVVK